MGRKINNNIDDTTRNVESTVDETLTASTEDTVNDTTSPAEPLDGIVSGCTKLNIRKKPNINSDVVCKVERGTKLLIASDTSTGEWYHVYLKDGNGTEGFCMKKYVTVKQ